MNTFQKHNFAFLRVGGLSSHLHTYTHKRTLCFGKKTMADIGSRSYFPRQKGGMGSPTKSESFIFLYSQSIKGKRVRCDIFLGYLCNYYIIYDILLRF